MADIKVGRMILGPVATNSYYIFREGSPAAVLIDPPASGERIYLTLKDKGLDVEKILLTHAHFDHIGGIEGIEKKESEDNGNKVPVACLDAERPLCESAELNCSISMGGRGETVDVDEWLHDGDVTQAAGITIRVIATPGHTAGGCCFYIEEAGLLISGDTLFEGSVGRSDLPTGNMATLVRSIKEKLFTLPDDTLVLPGHGGETTIGDEKKYNPFVS